VLDRRVVEHVGIGAAAHGEAVFGEVHEAVECLLDRVVDRPQNVVPEAGISFST
jgi:hypothetical protein